MILKKLIIYLFFNFRFPLSHSHQKTKCVYKGFSFGVRINNVKTFDIDFYKKPV